MVPPEQREVLRQELADAVPTRSRQRGHRLAVGLPASLITRSLANAAGGGLKPPPEGRPRRVIRPFIFHAAQQNATQLPAKQRPSMHTGLGSWKSAVEMPLPGRLGCAPRGGWLARGAGTAGRG